ncbi:hypothetical protein RH858_15095 [Halalkaliarchaeum sp. AArc-GB]|uniref:helix-turn-helix transcriptional regulator n=1 Tax=Halalkaliarchaeum sp. AArc-GB TaxID=3074078 RepID=UPI0028545683|nr:helix-turn-helix domain-containing protein [Halalkaliarchaeum sp. AArc-GB]MDR5674451.1 hypothetical protein [Halalkaliarchaeum sp. AArc-GB]
MRLSALLAAVVLLGALAGAVAASPATGASAPDPSADTLQPSIDGDQSHPFESLGNSENPPETTIRIVLHDDGNATWNVTVEYGLDTDAERDAFDDFATDFEGGTADAPFDVETFERIVSVADDSTDREMAMTDVRRTAEQTEDVGTLRVEFTWTAFLATDGDQLVLDDALTTAADEPLLGSLESNQQLVIVTPDGYQVDTTPGVNPDLREGNAWLEGPQLFTAEDRLIVTYSPVDTDPTPGTPTETADGSWEIIGGAFLIGAAILIAALLYRRKTEGPDIPSDAVVPTAGENSSGDTPSPTDEGAVESDGREGADDEVDLSLLSDEERVERLLEQRSGRMRQAAIVEETGWSDAKVSQLLSTMAEDGRVEKLRLGRENLISLPEDADEGENGDTDAEE